MAHLLPAEAFEVLKNRTSKTISSYFPIEGKKNSLRAKKVWVDDNLEWGDLRTQKDAKLKGRSWAVPVRAELELVDKTTGKVKDTQTVTLAKIPKITNRYSYIVGGNEYQVNNQFRLKAGAYTRVRANGELTTQWNMPEGGLGFDVNFDPRTKKMTMKHVGKGSNIALYPVLKSLGVDDDTIERQWGREIFNANKTEKEETALKKFYKTFKGTNPPSMEAARSLVVEEMDRTKLRPDVTKLTLGTAFTKVTGPALMAGSQKLLRVARQEEKPDDRDALQFKDFLSAEDLVGERLEKNQTRRTVTRKIANTLDKRSKVREIVNPDFFGKPIRYFFTNSTLSERSDQTNPTSFLIGNRRTTLMGEGGISSDLQLTMEAKSINPSHMGFLDPLQTPESERTGVSLQLAMGARKQGTELKTQVYDVKKGKSRWVSPLEALTSNVAFPDQYRWVGDKAVPVGPSVKVADKNGDITTVKPAEVDYVMRSAKKVFDIGANMIPFLQNDQGNRTMMGVKQLEQAIGLSGREAPLVQSMGEGGRTAEGVVGRFVSQSSPVDGVVSRITKEAIYVKDKNGKEHEKQIYNNFPLNDDKSKLHSEPIVKVGDTVKAGQTLADSNFTRNSELALGTNLQVAYMPYKGYNFEDGIVISESAAKKLTSDHMFRQGVTAEKNIVLNKKKFLAETAGSVTQEQAEKLDDFGVIKPGSPVNQGDILIGVMKKQEVTPEQRKLGIFNKRFLSPVRPQEVRWEKDTPGTVTRVVKHGKNTTVYVNTQVPATIGDKIVGRHGNKGIITCHDDKTEVLTEEGWKRFQDLNFSERVCTLNPNTGKVEYHYPCGYIAEPYEGKMYRYQGRRLDLFCTPEHRHYVRTRRGEFRLEEARYCFGLPRAHLRVGKWEAPDLEEVIIPGRPDGYKLHKEFCEPRSYDPDLFLEFFGYWVTEGCLAGTTHVHVAQSREKNPETYERVVEVLRELGYEPCLQPNVVVISDPRLHYWLRQFGKAREKFIPRVFLDASARQLRTLADAVFAGDGGTYYGEKDNHTRHELFTSSKRLADDYQELAFKVGVSANVKPQEKEDGTEYVVRWTFKEEVWVNNDKRYKNESWEHYEGNIYCVTVQNHIVYVRRNGIPVWSGNCVLPDHEMPRTKDGKAAQVLLNPTGIPSRINVGQVLETAAAKIAEKTGQTYKVNNFDPDNKDYTRNLMKELKSHGIKDTEEMVDPATGKSFGNVLFGPQYILKLHHTAAKGLSARSRHAYDSNMVPQRGGPHGGQTMDAMGMYALLAHNSRENIREMQTYRSDNNDQFWEMIQSGDSPPAPKVPFVFKKFEGYLKGMGVDMLKEGNDLILQPLTDQKTLEMSNGELKNPNQSLRGKDLKPESGGIFDTKVTGTEGLNRLGTKWSHIKLSERMPNPVFEGPIASLLGINKKDVPGIVAGKRELNGKKGPAAIADALGQIKVDKEAAALKAALPTMRTSKLNKANKRMKYLRALQKAGTTPVEAYTMKHLPVLPPTMRPVTLRDNGDLVHDDINDLYTGIGKTNYQLKTMDPGMPEEEKEPLHEALYDGLKGLTLTGTESQGKHLNGIAEVIAGRTSPKEGFFQQKVIGRRQDLSMRGTIVPEPSLSLDEVAVPRKAAAEVYKPFVVANLVNRRGYAPLMAQEKVKEDGVEARAALDEVIAERPLLLKRDPVLHKYGVQAFKPRLVTGQAIKIHPLATTGYNADFDGDKMSAYVPVSQKAVKEAWKMLPSNNLFSPSTGFVMFQPTQESMQGLFKLTEMGKSTGKSFKNSAEAAKAVKDGKIGLDDIITVKELDDSPLLSKLAAAKRTTVGRLLVHNTLPQELRSDKLLTDKNYVLNRDNLQDLLTSVAAVDKGSFGEVSDKLKDLGNARSTGLSIGLEDFLSDYEHRDKVLAQAGKVEAQIRANKKLTPAKRDEKIVQLYIEAGKDIDAKAQAKANAKPNRMYDWVRSKARGSWDNYKQMTVTPLLVADTAGKPIPVPITKSYSEGLDIGSYWASMYGARMGTISRAEGTWRPGLMSKEMMRATMNQMIVSEDCGTKKGMALPLDERDILGRFTVNDIRLKKGGKAEVLPAGTLIDPDVVNRLKNNRVSEVPVRTPLRCLHGKGMCSKCYGLNEDGQLHQQGVNVGVIAAHALGEPATQLSMNCNAAGNLVLSEDDESRVRVTTFEELWDSVRSFVDEEDGLETKIPMGLSIWDQDQFVPVLTMQRHRPTAEMVLVRTESGHSLVVEEDHPMWVRKDVVACPECTHEEPVRFVGHYKDRSKTSVRCRRCHSPFQVTPGEYEDQQERVVAARDLEGFYVGVSKLEANNVPYEEPPLPPYLLGMYLAEGNVRRTKKTSGPAPGSKRRHSSPYGLLWKPLGVCLSQNEGEIRDRVLEELNGHGIPYTENTDKCITLHDVELSRWLWSACGTGSDRVRLPSGWTSWPTDDQEGLLAGVLDGDGSLKGGSPVLDTTSWALASQVAELVRTLGGYACIYDTTWRENSVHQGYRVSITLCREIPSVKEFKVGKRSDWGSYSKVVSVKVVRYDGWTYDVSTPTRAFSSNGVRNHNSFHTGGVVGAKGTAAQGTFDRVNQLLQVPKILPGSATLSKADGKVDKVDKDPAGGWSVYVSGQRHYVPPTRDLAVKKGQQVKKGEAVSSGVKNPREMLPLTGMPTVQRYITDELHGIYKDVAPVKRRNTETFVRAMTNLSKVTDPGGHDTYLHGDTVPSTEVAAYNSQKPAETKPVRVEPLLHGVSALPLEVQTDWLARMQATKLRSTVLDASAEGWRSALHSTHPIPGMAYGATFGQGTKEEPWLY